MLHKQAVSLNCVHYYYIGISIANFTHDNHFSILVAMLVVREGHGLHHEGKEGGISVLR